MVATFASTVFYFDQLNAHDVELAYYYQPILLAAFTWIGANPMWIWSQHKVDACISEGLMSTEIILKFLFVIILSALPFNTVLQLERNLYLLLVMFAYSNLLYLLVIEYLAVRGLMFVQLLFLYIKLLALVAALFMTWDYETFLAVLTLSNFIYFFVILGRSVRSPSLKYKNLYFQKIIHNFLGNSTNNFVMLIERLMLNNYPKAQMEDYVKSLVFKGQLITISGYLNKYLTIYFDASSYRKRVEKYRLFVVFIFLLLILFRSVASDVLDRALIALGVEYDSYLIVSWLCLAISVHINFSYTRWFLKQKLFHYASLPYSLVFLSMFGVSFLLQDTSLARFALEDIFLSANFAVVCISAFLYKFTDVQKDLDLRK